jgi:hypothetical protein
MLTTTTLIQMLRMSTSRVSFFFVPKQRPYHHGNLRPELLKAALRLIRETGSQGFTLREVARRAGVSHNAPYRRLEKRNTGRSIFSGTRQPIAVTLGGLCEVL